MCVHVCVSACVILVVVELVYEHFGRKCNFVILCYYVTLFYKK